MMEVNKEKSEPVEAVTPDCFHDFAVCFSEAEWRLLHDWQTDLYELVMKEIQEAVTSLGGPVSDPNVLFSRPRKTRRKRKSNQGTTQQEATTDSPWFDSDIDIDTKQTSELNMLNDCNGEVCDNPTTTSADLQLFDSDTDIDTKQTPELNMLNDCNGDVGDNPTTTSADLPLLDSDTDIGMKQASELNLLNYCNGDDSESPATITAVHSEHDEADPVQTDPILFSEKMQLAHQQLEEGVLPQQLPNEKTASESETPAECIHLRHPSSVFTKKIKEGVLARLLIVQPEMSPTKDEEPILNIFDHFGEEIRRNNTKLILTCEGTSFHINNIHDTKETDSHFNKKRERDSSPTNEQCMHVKRTDCSTTPVHEATARKSVLEKEKVAGFRRGLKETISRRLQWSMSNQQPRGRHLTRDENAFGHLKNSAVSAATSNRDKSNTKACKKKRGGRPKKKNHAGPFSCPECPQSYTHICSLNRHRRIHMGERTYHCAICRKNFSQRQHLMQHQCIHSQEQPFTCARCGKSFSSKKNLNKHRIWQHVKKTVTWGPDPAV